MCRRLGLDEQAVPRILSQLGADRRGQVSCDDFLRAWLELRTEVERLRGPPTDGLLSDAAPGEDPGQTQILTGLVLRIDMPRFFGCKMSALARYFRAGEYIYARAAQFSGLCNLRCQGMYDETAVDISEM